MAATAEGAAASAAARIRAQLAGLNATISAPALAKLRADLKPPTINAPVVGQLQAARNPGASMSAATPAPAPAARRATGEESGGATRAANGGARGHVTVNVGGIRVDGSRDPKATADAVAAQLVAAGNRATSGALHDGVA